MNGSRIPSIPTSKDSLTGFANLYHRAPSLHPGMRIMDAYVAGRLYARLIIGAWNPANGRTVTVLPTDVFNLLVEQGIYPIAKREVQEESLSRMTRKELYAEIDASYKADDESRIHAAVQQLARMSLPTEDAAQDAAIAVWQSLASHDPEQNFHTWVNGVIRHFRRPALQENIEARSHIELTRAVTAEAVIEERLYMHDTEQIGDPLIRDVTELLQQGYNLSEIAKQKGMTANALQLRVWRYSTALQRNSRKKLKKVAA